ncbi:MAG TPA: response regulator transcription factor [Polyangiaceae bacterium]|nr:response regulator transcription factor [Polyangiaceae bacterium]
MLNKRILVVDDEPRIREVVQYALEREGCQVLSAPNAKQGLALLGEEAIDLVVLDIMLPDANGLDLCRELRAKTQVPILFLSARGEEVDRVIGLEVGADDYLAKPFGTRELVARIKAVLRRTQALPSDAPPEARTRLEIGDLSLDLERHEVRVRTQPVALTHMEFSLLRVLMQRPEVVFERQSLLREARAEDTHITERTVDTHVRRIRAKLRECGLSPVVTVHGVGYKLVRNLCSMP